MKGRARLILVLLLVAGIVLALSLREGLDAAALEHWVEQSKSDPVVLKRAVQVRAEIERDAETKRNAINAVLGDKDSKTTSARTTKQTQAPQGT